MELFLSDENATLLQVRLWAHETAHAVAPVRREVVASEDSSTESNEGTVARDDTLGQKLNAVDTLGAQIRDLKACNEPESKVMVAVTKMNDLKLDLIEPLLSAIAELEVKLDEPGCDAWGEAEAVRLCNFLPPSHKKKVEKRLRAGRKSREAATLAAKRKLFEPNRFTDELRIQRKIHHLLVSEGQGDEFVYYSKLRPVHGILASARVYLTEKWDGTTAQATNKGVFKRCDRFAAGDTRKHHALESERYCIERLDIPLPRIDGSVNTDGGDGSTLDESHQYLRRAVDSHLAAFAGLPDGVCVYFEACGVNIQARFAKQAAVQGEAAAGEEEEWYDIRVFDFTQGGRFLPWSETVELAGGHGLPTVGFTGPTPLDLSSVLANLNSKLRYASAVASGHPAGRALLEGFVVRAVDCQEGGHSIPGIEDPVAKIRVDDLEKIITPVN